MTPNKTAVDTQTVLDEMVTDLKYMLMLAQRIQTTEQVEQGTEEWDSREKAKDLFNDGIARFIDWFEGMRTW